MMVFEKQIWHILILILLILGIIILTNLEKEILLGSLWHVPTKTWFIISLVVPIIHQIYVLLCWRLELHYKLLTRKIGKTAFNFYLAGFFILFISRIIFITLLSESNKNTFDLDIFSKYAIAGVLSIIVIYAFYSVKKYFGIKRAAGLDHFDSNIAKLSFVKEGIFKYTNNGMYTYAFLIIYLPAILNQSKAALLVAVFSHIYIWVHYFFTELPDIKRIYKKTDVSKKTHDTASL
jgi:Phospholipid methyltransferase